jgi:hypothetical protein
MWKPFLANAVMILAYPVLVDSLPGAENDGCRIYMAPSSLTGSSGFGVYTTRPVNKGERFLNGPDGPNIPVLDFIFPPNLKDSLEKERNAWISLFDHYWWGRGVADQVIYEAATSVMDFQINFGSLPNHHCVLVSHSTQRSMLRVEAALITIFLTFYSTGLS